jgi:methionyl aminopeptidase
MLPDPVTGCSAGTYTPAMASSSVADTAPLGTLVPGVISAQREVPGHIARPPYVGRPGPDPYTGPEVKDAQTLAAMRVACRIAAQALAEVGAAIRPGVSTDELDRIGHEFLCDHGAYPSTLGYRGFPKSLCTSINEVVCHGIPDSTVLVEGDICNVDITAYIGGVHGDTNATFFAGEPDPQSRWLVEHAEAAMMRGIRAALPGRQFNVIGKVIESYARRHGLDTVHEFTGHGIGTAFHDSDHRRRPGDSHPALTVPLWSVSRRRCEPSAQSGGIGGCRRRGILGGDPLPSLILRCQFRRGLARLRVSGRRHGVGR